MKLTLHKAFTQSLLVVLGLWVFAPTAQAAGTSKTYTFTIERTMDQTAETNCPASADVIKSDLGLSTLDLSSSTVNLYSIQATTGKPFKSYNKSPYGNYFTLNGNVTSSSRSAVAYITYDTSTSVFHVAHVTGTRNAVDGTTYTMTEAIINETSNDTLFFVFVMTMGTKQSMTSDMPSYVHRADKKDAWGVHPYVQVNDQTGEYNNCVQGNAGDNIAIGVRQKNADDRLTRYIVYAPDGTKLTRTNNLDDYVINSAEKSDIGSYRVACTYYTADDKLHSENVYIFVDVQEHQGEYYDWDKETPYWSYDFRSEYPNFKQPTKTFTFKQKNGKAAYMVEGEWWTVYWGDNLNTEVWGGTSGETVEGDRKHAMTNAMKKFDEDYAYIRNEMGWPPDLAAREGYKSFVYVFGSGLSNDKESNTTEGGYQGYTQPANANKGYACVFASWNPMSRFRDDAKSRYSDWDYQTNAMIHEGIHATFADYPGCKSSAWFQEAGNVWLQGAMNAKRGQGAQVSGWLGVGNLICPFMPIECYSGWLQDGSFGGPAAEGVNMYNGGQQICTWRNLIGGVQYGETFPIFLGLNVGQGSVPWIWRYCTDYVLKGIAQGNAAEGVAGIGDEGMRQLILHYRAKLATMDFKESSDGMRNLLDGAFGTIVKPEWEPYWINCAPFKLTPYQTLTLNDDEGWMAPDELTNPGWSGGNIIPIHVGKDGCEIFFRPEDDNMRAQLCYRTKDGRTFYSQPVLCGKMVLNWDDTNQPANGVIFAVVCNTDYIYEGDAQRKKHWDYRLKLGRGAYAPADINQKWYFYERTITDPNYNEEIYTDVQEIAVNNSNNGGKIRILSSVLKGGQKIQLDLGGIPANELKAHLVGLSGVVIDEQQVADDGTIQLPAQLQRGLYVLALNHNGKIQSFKVYAE